jgi:hypothetical protein
MNYWQSSFLCLLAFLLLSSNIATQNLENLGQQPAVQLSGNLQLGTQFYQASGIDGRSTSPNWNMSGSANLQLYEVSLPFSFTLGQQGQQLNYPRFAQFGMSPTYRWLKVHAGWRNLNFSNYSLAGHSFLGVGVEMDPGLWRIGVMYGRLRSARMATTSVAGGQLPARYQRNGMAFKLGIGEDNQFIDLIYFQAKDDPNSLPSGMIDSTLKAAENAIVACTWRLPLGKKINFTGELAGNMLNRDQRSNLAADYLSTSIPTPLEVRTSTQLNYAVRGGLEFDFSPVLLRTTFERIMPEFNSLGSYFFANDLQRWLIAPKISFAQRKVNLSGSLGLERNNLLGYRLETTRRVVGNAVLNINPNPRFGADINFTNYSIDQLDSRLDNIDSVRVAMVTTNYSVSPHWQWQDSLRSQQIFVLGQFQALNDRNPFTREFTNMETWLAMVSYNLGILPSQWSFNFSLQAQRIDVYPLRTNRFGGSFGVNKSTKDGRWSVSLHNSVFKNYLDQEADGLLLSSSLNLSFAPAKRHQLSLYTSLNHNKSEQFANYTELFGGIQYQYRWR